MLHLCWGCAPFSVIDKDDLSPAELEKVQAVKVFGEWEGFEEKDLSELSYTVIHKVKGVSCEKGKHVSDTNLFHALFGVHSVKYIKIWEPNRNEAIEQLKIRAARIGGHAIANISCTYDSFGRTGRCHKWLECEADVIQLDKGDACNMVYSSCLMRAGGTGSTNSPVIFNQQYCVQERQKCIKNINRNDFEKNTCDVGKESCYSNAFSTDSVKHDDCDPGMESCD
jgi:uncharacterized protein YbjQ (UPF0145 family)